MKQTIEQTIGKTFLAIAEGLETGSFGTKPKLAVTGLGSEHGEANVMAAAVEAAKSGIDVYYVGTLQHDGVTTISVGDEDEGHAKMESLLTDGIVDGAVTMHFPFPIGVATIGRVITPAQGKTMFLASTTGTASTHRVEAMVRNAIYGIITAKACGITEPSVGILNVDGARHVEKALRTLVAQGYPIRFAESRRSDGGCIMRGNDVLQGVPDVLVTDSLTGNILVKMLSSFTTGGSYEAVGYGYGPGIGDGYDKLVLIISRASGTPVITNALAYGATLVRGQVFTIAQAEFAAVRAAGWDDILASLTAETKPQTPKTVTMPPKEVVTAQILGIDILDLDDAVQCLWSAGVYAESGMGCTGPVIRVSDGNLAKSQDLLKTAGYGT